MQRIREAFKPGESWFKGFALPSEETQEELNCPLLVELGRVKK